MRSRRRWAMLAAPLLLAPLVSAAVTAGPAAASDPTQTSYSLGVLVLQYYPTADGVNIDQSVTGDVSGTIASVRSHVSSVTSNLMTDLSAATKYRGYSNPSAPPALTFHVVNTLEYDNAVPTVANPAYNPPSNPYAVRPDYPSIMNTANICNYVNNQGVNEVWMFAYQGPSQLQLDESKMSGPYGDVSNEWFHDNLPVCNHTYTLYSFNYGRGTAEAFESHGHQYEYELRYVDNQQYNDGSYLFNTLFEGDHYPQTDGVTGRCGSDHNPPNAKSEYDRADTSPWPSDCLNWAPTATPGPTTQISCGVTWDAPSCANNGDSDNPALDYDIWWEQNFPGRGNTITYNGLPFRNWWDVHGEWDTIEGGTPSLTLPPAALSCHIGYSTSPSGGTFTANIVINNTGTTAINGWTLGFTLPGNETLTQPGWSATYTQNGQNVAATNVSYDAAINPGTNVTIGFNGTYSGTYAGNPASFTVNGVTCT